MLPTHFHCTTCPYQVPIVRKLSSQTLLASHQKKSQRDDDILGGAAAWEHVDRTATTCPACNGKEAYFQQIQIRSADEPMSVFYKCVTCAHQWNEK